MAKQLQLRRGTTSQHSTFTGANGEVTVDTDKDTVVVHDGTTAGGSPLATESLVASKADTTYVDSEISAIPSSLSKVASNVLLSGNLALASSAVTKSNANITYTGNGSTQSITTGIASVDFTVASNGSGYYHDRAAGDCIVKNDAGTIIESGSCVVNVSKVHIKSRDASNSHCVFDGLRGETVHIQTNTTYYEILAGSGADNNRCEFNSNGFSLNSGSNSNQSNIEHIAHQTLYTHIKWGLTNQGKRYITAYNPVTREVMTMYQGSGVAGHQIPNPLGIKLDYIDNKNLDTTDWWVSQYNNDNGYLNTTTAFNTSGVMDLSANDYIELTFAGGGSNGNNQSHISYGFANSETKIITQYQGTGASGNFVETKDVNGVAKKPRRVIIKRTDSTGNWETVDSERGNTLNIRLDDSIAEFTYSHLSSFDSNGFTLGSSHANSNASGGQYIALVEFDTTNSNDDTYFDLPTDDTNLNVLAGKLPYTDGRDATNGAYNVFTQSYTGSVDFSTCPDGIHYVALDSNNAPKFYETKLRVSSKTLPTYSADKDLVLNTDTGKIVECVDDSEATYNTNDIFGDGSTLATHTFNNTLNSLSGGTSSLSGTVLYTNGKYGNALNLPATNSDLVSTSLEIKTISMWIYRDSNIATITGNAILDARYVGGSGAGYIVAQNNTLSFADLTVTLNGNSVPSGVSYLADTWNHIIITFNTPQTGIEFSNVGSTTASYGFGGKFEQMRFFNRALTEAEIETLYTEQAYKYNELTTPISFIDDKPYQVASGTPMDRLVDYPSIPKNVMESSYVDGDLEVSGEVKGKNQCTAWVNFDGTTTPPTIRDSFNVSSVIRTATGNYDVYFEEDMDNINYTVNGTSGDTGANYGAYLVDNSRNKSRTTQKLSIWTGAYNTLQNSSYVSIDIKGGKN